MPSLTRRQRAAPDVAGRVGALSLALEHGEERLDPDAAETARLALARTDERIRLGAEHTVVALAGATGSGKSSLFNALAGLEVAAVGARRPTTATPTACVWGDGAEALMDWLDVPRRHRTHRESELDASDQADLHGLVLLDLPDHDSTRLSHRLEVDRLVGLVDLLVWVVDPQKYADEALHSRYLRTLTQHESVMLIVLNQTDRLAPDEVDACRRDLRRLLAEDGLPAVRVLTTSARTGDGVPALREIVAEAVERRESVAQRAAADLDAAAAGLSASVGETEGDPDKVTGASVLVDALAGAAGVPAVLDAVQGDYRRRAAGHVGWPFTRWLRRFRPDPLKRLRLGQATSEAIRLERSSLPEPTQAQRAQVELATRRVAEQAGSGLPERWGDAVRGAATPPGPDLADALDQAVTGVDLEHRRPLWWPVFGLVQVLLALAAVAGFLWLGALFVIGWLQLPELETPRLGSLPWPTVLLVGGLVTGLVLALVGGRLASFGARRRRRRVGKRLRAAVREVAASRVLGPVGDVLRDHRATRLALARKT
ncbi:MAG TPA: YfjP family GTPase [Actinomycetales bacterium]|nr:YfjP family GTPase [Actinomycetales bacterium]